MGDALRGTALTGRGRTELGRGLGEAILQGSRRGWDGTGLSALPSPAHPHRPPVRPGLAQPRASFPAWCSSHGLGPGVFCLGPLVGAASLLPAGVLL